MRGRGGTWRPGRGRGSRRRQGALASYGRTADAPRCRRVRVRGRLGYRYRRRSAGSGGAPASHRTTPSLTLYSRLWPLVTGNQGKVQPLGTARYPRSDHTNHTHGITTERCHPLIGRLLVRVQSGELDHLKEALEEADARNRLSDQPPSGARPPSPDRPATARVSTPASVLGEPPAPAAR